MKTLTFAVGAAVLLFSAPALAQCSKDTDCKGDRVCSNGQCIDTAHPAPVAGPTVVVQPAAPAPVIVVQPPPPLVQAPPPLQLQPPKLDRPKPKSGWAVGAGIVGLVFMPVILGLTGASEATRTSLDPSLPLGITALVLHIVMVPIVGSGGSSARKGFDISGAVPLRVFAWIFYGLTIAGGVVTAVLGAAGDTPPGGLIIGMGGASALALLFLSIDNFISAGQAKALANRMENGEASRLEMREYIAPMVMPDGSVGGTVGFVGRF